MLRTILAVVATVLFCSAPIAAQQVVPPGNPPVEGEIGHDATGGAQTLEDILARQRGEEIDDSFRREAIGNPDNAASMTGQLGTLGGVSDAELWRALRYGEANVTVSAGGDVATVLVQDGGMRWYEFRQGPLRTYGGWLLIGTLIALAVFFLVRGRIKIDGGKIGRTVTRFEFIERASHWLLAGSFILLGITGLFSLFGRPLIAPYLGKEFNSTLLIYSKLIHNNVAWAFIVALVMVFVMWVAHNIPNRTDLKWFAQAGGIIGNKHPPAKKFNAGQKIIFWSVILLGASISVSGLALLFPFEIQLFGKTFAFINWTGVLGWFDIAPLPEYLAPQEEMQLAQLWHAIVAFVLMAIILAHIYIGSVGMEGAFDAMGNGEVDEAWAHQHHSIWLEELKEKGEAPPDPDTDPKVTPAE
ncbi:formate dehydrogenase subunit gamma [Pseudoruegeria sp. HB172150]|uniref:formate dehydrogenase subunit gamma n=1 Tax=Pseudoruegeria sp. HB172150 TaxID=2721164 RepID=UPI001556F9C8|nr:formate dehydrogenase subunit gamma [Pseudoruegeria sp. HB172150]